MLKEENHLDVLKNTLEFKCHQIEVESAIQIKEIESSIRQLEYQRQDELLLVERAKGSLCEWLDSNVKGWERSIGKIADEKSVLYSQNLSPRLTDTDTDTDSFFGISLDLDSIEKDVRTPSMIKKAVGSLDRQIQTLANRIIQLREETRQRISEAGKEIRSQVKSIQAKIDILTQNIQICRRQSEEELLRMDAIKEEESKYLEEIVRSFDDEIQDLQSQINGLSDERKNVDSTCEAELRKVYKTISNEEKSDKTRKDSLLASLAAEVAEYTKGHDSKLKQLEKDESAELSDSGADMRMLDNTRKELVAISAAVDRIDREREKIAEYRKDCRELLNHVPQMQVDRKKLEDKQETLKQKYCDRYNRLSLKLQEENKAVASLRVSYKHATESKQKADEFIVSKACPPELQETIPIPTELDCIAIISSIQELIVDIHKLSDRLKEDTNELRKRFSPNNTFKFPTEFDTLEDYHRYADSLEDFVSNNKIKDFQQVTSNLYRDILSRAASDFNFLLGRESEIIRIVKAINHDFEKKTFAGVIRSIELRLDRSTMPIITQLQNITDFWNAHQYELGEVNLFSTDEHTDVNKDSIKYLKSLSTALQTASDLKKLPLEQTFALKFRIQENDNVTDWVDNIRAIGSEGTDILVKAIINILLISVFKNRAGQGDDFRLHCMMDEIGRLADENIQGILNFANQRGIFIVNSSPKAHRPLSYRRLYMLSKDKKAYTTVQPILSTREAELL